MTEINFTSTYRIPITQAGVNSAKKARLKELIQSYPNGLIGNSKTGNARISISDKEDANFIAKLKKIGYKVYQKFEGENIDTENLDIFIKEKLDSRNFHQKGKSPERLSRKVKEQRRYERRTTPTINEEPEVKTSEKIIAEPLKEFGKKPLTPEQIRQSQNYLDMVKEEGVEFAEAVCFGIKKEH